MGLLIIDTNLLDYKQYSSICLLLRIMANMIKFVNNLKNMTQ